MPKFFKAYFLILSFLLSFPAFADIVIPSQPIPGPPGFTLIEILAIINFIGSFFTRAGAILAIIAVIISGIMWMKAGEGEKGVEKAKAWLKNSLIGALIVFGAGVILNTISNIVTREFFCKLDILGICIWK